MGKLNFGAFIHIRRTALGLDLRTCAERCGLGNGTISRLENERSRPALQTALQACQGLEVSLASLLDEWLGSHEVLLEPAPALPDEALLTPDDVEAFIRSFRANPLACSTWVADSLNGLLATEGVNLALFAPVDVVKLLFSDSPVFHFEILYPAEVAPETLLSLSRSGGMLTFRDAGHYLERMRKARGRTLSRLGGGLGISPSTLSLIESGEQDQIKLADVIALDEHLEQGGRLLLLYWGAADAKIGIERRLSERHEAPWSVYEERLAEVLVRVWRWICLQDLAYAQRLVALRHLDLQLEPAESGTFPSAWLHTRLNYPLPAPSQAQVTGDNRTNAPSGGAGERSPVAIGERQATESRLEVLRERNRELGRLLQEARQHKKLPLSACARLIGTSEERYLAMEAGESPIGAAELEVFVRHLGIPPGSVWPGGSPPLLRQEGQALVLALLGEARADWHPLPQDIFWQAPELLVVVAV